MKGLGDLCRDVMLDIALRQKEHAAQRELLEIMHADGWLSDEEMAALAPLEVQ